ncbi:MAG: hypothetical protein ACK574_02210 [Bacteroidota bacterium]|jgi:hypothetical protein
MPQKLNISVCLDDLYAQSKAGHPRFKKNANGKTYVSLNVWVNEQPDKFGNNVSVQLYDANAERKVIYVGNGRTGEAVEKQQEKSDTGTPF